MIRKNWILVAGRVINTLTKNHSTTKEENTMTRFERELSGELGAFWKKDAEEELERVKADLEVGKITIDENGVARNCIGRALQSDMMEKLLHITDRADAKATAEASSEEAAEAIENYRRNHRTTREELQEMRAAFGEGETVVDIFTGETFTF